MKPDYRTALSELSVVLDGVDTHSVDEACRMIADANTLLLYGCGQHRVTVTT